MINDFGKEFIPKRKTKESAGYDIYCPETIVLEPGKDYVIDTGVKIEDSDIGVMNIEYDYAFMHNFVSILVPRSSYGFNYGLKLANTIGVIDCDYRDSIKVKISVEKELILKKGDRFAQMILIPFLTFIDEIKPKEDRSGGIGSTGE